MKPIERGNGCVAFLCFLALSTTAALRDDSLVGDTKQCTGVRVGELRPTSVIIWTRSARTSTRQDAANAPLGPCPGANGKIYVQYSSDKGQFGSDMPSSTNSTAVPQTPTVSVGLATDFSHKFVLGSLEPDTVYYYRVFVQQNQTSKRQSQPTSYTPLSGTFRTPPHPTTSNSSTRFTLATCQQYKGLDDPQGFGIYPSMAKQQPHFSVFLGDNVYFDNDIGPRATSVVKARFHYQRMFSLPNLIEFHRNFGVYFSRDDHDTLYNNCDPSSPPAGSLTFKKGQALFMEQMPVDQLAPPGRSYSFGTNLKIWILNCRDFKIPGKTVLGSRQKQWLKSTVIESKATWRLILTSTPIVGPDKPEPDNDNLSDPGFEKEGNEIRAFLGGKYASSGNIFVITGDRHWQYHSVDPGTGLHEFDGGPASDAHVQINPPGFQPKYHKFYRKGGGFVSVDANASTLVIRLHDVAGTVKHSFTANARRPVH